MSDALPSSLKRSRIEAPELIEHVHRHVCLWDRNCIGYYNRPVKEQAWRDICRALQPDYDDMSLADRHETGITMMRRWYNIRDAYKKSRSSKSHSARPYVHAELLTFLDHQFDDKARTDAIKCELVEENDHEREEEWMNGFEADQSEATPAKRRRPDQYYLPTERTETDENVLSVLVNLIEKEDDEDRAFFKSITPAVKSLPDEVKFLFRIRVMKLLNKLKGEKKTARISEESDTN